MTKIIFAVLALSIGFSASALTLKEKKLVEAAKKDLSDEGSEGYGKLVQKKCGYSIPVTFDESMITTFAEKNSGLASHCDPRWVIAQMCDDATSKKEITQKIKKVTCKLNSTADIALKLTGGTLEVSVAPGATNTNDKIKTFLENNL